MNRRRRFTLGLGIVLGTTGLVFVFAPSVSVAIPVPSVVVAGIALLALVLTLFFVRDRLRDDPQSITLPTPESRTHAVPGEEIDRRIGSLSVGADQGSGDLSPVYSALQTRVKRVALSILGDDTHEQLSEATWTDDHRVAFVNNSSQQFSVREHLHSLRTGEPSIQRRARQTIAVLARRLYTDPPSGIPSADPERTPQDGESISVQPLPSGVDRADESGGDIDFPEAGETITHRTERWQGASALALAIGAGGMLLRQPALLLVSGIGVGLAAYSRAAIPPSVPLEIERTISNTSPAVEADVRVTVTVRNVGDVLLPDCSVIDGVPPGLVVTDGSPRHGVALRPGSETTVSYTLLAARGEHTFGPPAVIARDFSGSVERLTRVEPSGETTITCVPRLESLETLGLRPYATRFNGRVMSDTGGNGVEFHATREYRSSDPRSRIDWNRLAKTGELSTLQFRNERSTTVTLVIDAREEAYLAPDSEGRCAVDRSVTAAGRLFATLLDATLRVGVGALSTHPQACWLSPGCGDAHRRRGRRLLACHPAIAATYPTNSDSQSGRESPFERLSRRLPPAGQVVVLTPLCDEMISDSIQRLVALGHAVTVISPDPTAVTSPGRQLVHIERALRITRLQSRGIPVLDWGPASDDPLSVALDRLQGQHSGGVGVNDGRVL